jgi:hypothetical protein
MVFLIQHTQNRDTQALQIKLDELIRSTQGAHNALLDLEELEEKDLQAFQDRYEALAEKARACGPLDEGDAGTPEVGMPDGGTNDVDTRDEEVPPQPPSP